MLLAFVRMIHATRTIRMETDGIFRTVCKQAIALDPDRMMMTIIIMGMKCQLILEMDLSREWVP